MALLQAYDGAAPEGAARQAVGGGWRGGAWIVGGSRLQHGWTLEPSGSQPSRVSWGAIGAAVRTATRPLHDSCRPYWTVSRFIVPYTLHPAVPCVPPSPGPVNHTPALRCTAAAPSPPRAAGGPCARTYRKRKLSASDAAPSSNHVAREVAAGHMKPLGREQVAAERDAREAAHRGA